jgi:hypothetical protein
VPPVASVDPRLAVVSRKPLVKGGILTEFLVPTADGPDKLVFRDARGMGPFWYRYLVAAALGCLAVSHWFLGQTVFAVAWTVLAALITLLIILDLILGKPCVTVDRGAGLLSFGRPGKEKTRALAGIAGVQLLQTGAFLRYKYLQINLAWANSEESRLCVATNADPAWARHTGKQLADFLRVPLLDQTDGPS